MPILIIVVVKDLELLQITQIVIILPSGNTASNGPNFLDPSTDDYVYIVFSSLSMMTMEQTPEHLTTDFDGNSRIHTTDIGVYEVQYSQMEKQPR